MRSTYGGNGATSIEDELGVVGSGHGVGSGEVEQVSRSSNDGLFYASGSSESEVVKSRVQEEGATGGDGAIESLLDGLLDAARERSNTGGIPYVSENGLEEGDEASIFALGSDLVDGHANVCDGSLGQNLEFDGEVTLVLRDKLRKQVARERESLTTNIMSRIELLCHVQVVLSPLVHQVALHDVSHAVTHKAGILLIAIHRSSEFTIRNHLLAIGIHHIVARLVAVRHNRDWHWQRQPRTICHLDFGN